MKIEKTFNAFMSGVAEKIEDCTIPCVMHWIELYGDARGPEAGVVCITIEGSETYQSYEFTLWGNGEEGEEYKNNYSDCYVCLPTVLEEDEEDELETVFFNELIDGLTTYKELGIKE